MDDFDDFSQDLLLSITGRDIVDAKTAFGTNSSSCNDSVFELVCMVLWRYDWDTVMCISDVVEEHL